MAHQFFRIKGLCCAPTTPMLQNGDINLTVIKEYVNHLLKFNCPNVFITGTTGEGNNLSVDERMKVMDAWIQEGKGRLTAIIAQIGAGNLRDSQTLARHAQSIGVHAIACVGPSYHKPDNMEMYVAYMKAVADVAPDLPFMLYDIDFVTGITLDVNTFFQMAKEHIPNLFGVKHTSPNFVSINNVLNDHPDFQVLLGTDECYLQGLAIGVNETIMNSYNGHTLTRLKEAFDNGDMETARKQQHRALAIGKLRKKCGLGLVDGSKAILSLLGLETGPPRVPIQPATEDQLHQLKSGLTDIGFFDWAVQ